MEFNPAKTRLQSEDPTASLVKSADYFVTLRKELMKDSDGNKSSFESLRMLERMRIQLQSFRVIESELIARAQQSRVLRSLQDLMRKRNAPKRRNFYVKSEDVQDHTTSQLKEIKAKLFEDLKVFNAVMGDVRDIDLMEIDKKDSELIKKYGKKELYELFDPTLDVTWDDMLQIVGAAHISIYYRERKLGEFLAYKYARSVPQSVGVEEFVLNAHQIVAPIYADGEYRTMDLKSSGKFFAPVPPELVPKLMSLFAENIKKRSEGAVKNSPKEAFKKYLLFEIIHPFMDGNGRVGRALFVYLQRRLSEDKKFHPVPLHIPVSRPEISQSLEEKGAKSEYNIPGSLSGRVNKIVSAVLTNPKVITLGLDLSEGKLSPEDFYDAIWDYFDGEEVGILLDQALLVMKEEGSYDSKESKDWSIISDKVRGGIKKAHATNRFSVKP